MSSVVGGLRAQLIRESIYQTLYQGMFDLGWFDANRRHRDITFPGITEDNDTEIPLNRLALSDEDQVEFPYEMGSTAATNLWTYWVDFYAEDASLGRHVMYDIKDILGGRMSTIGRSHPSVVVYDYRLATPVALFKVDIEDIVVDRGARTIAKPYQKFWYACRFTVVDTYDDEVVDREYEDFTYDSGPYE